MKRDFEREFKELKLSEIPDLWNRIEAGLSDKAITASAPERANVYKFNKRPRWRMFGTFAAACLCIAVIIPALSFVIGNLSGRRNNYSGTNSADTASDGFSGAAADSGAYDIAEEVNMTDVSEMTNDADAAYESDMKAEADMTATSGNREDEAVAASDDSDLRTQSSKNSGTIADAMAEDTADSISEAEAADKDSDNMENSLNGVEEKAMLRAQIYNDVVVEISESKIINKETVYKAVVKQPDQDGLLADGIEISMVCNSDTHYDFAVSSRTKKALKKGESYKVTLQYDNTEQNTDTSESGQYIVLTAGRQ